MNEATKIFINKLLFLQDEINDLLKHFDNLDEAGIEANPRFTEIVDNAKKDIIFLQNRLVDEIPF